MAGPMRSLEIVGGQTDYRICETLSPLALQAGGEKTSHVLLHWLQHYCETILRLIIASKLNIANNIFTEILSPPGLHFKG